MKKWRQGCDQSAESLTRFEAVSNPRIGHDVTRVLPVRFQFLPQVPDEHAQVRRLFNAVFTPNSRQQCTVGDDSARVPCQVQKEVKFLRSQADLPFLYADSSRLQVNAEITDCNQI